MDLANTKIFFAQLPFGLVRLEVGVAPGAYLDRGTRWQAYNIFHLCCLVGDLRSQHSSPINTGHTCTTLSTQITELRTTVLPEGVLEPLVLENIPDFVPSVKQRSIAFAFLFVLVLATMANDGYAENRLSVHAPKNFT